MVLALANLCQKSVAKCFGCGVPFKPNNAIPLAPVHIVFSGSVTKKVAQSIQEILKMLILDYMTTTLSYV